MSAAPQKVRVAVVGCGVFGRNHARVYRQLEHDGSGIEFVGVVDTQAERAKAIAQEFATEAFSSVADLKNNIDAASVTVPTVDHLAVARELMQAGADVLVEKPVAASLAQADELIALSRRYNRIVQVGHLERFNPAVLATIPIVTQPMFFEVHRLSVFTPRSLDVDVVMDLMIHDLDVVLSLVKDPVGEIRAVGLAVISDKVDIANVRLEFENGCVANLTASRVSTEKVRKLRFFQPQQYISIDYARQDVISIRVDERAAAALLRGQTVPEMSGPAPGVAVDKPKVEPKEPLRTEIEAFLESVRSRQKPRVSLEDGRRALDLALKINAAIDAHHSRAGLAHIG
ncbi:MAG TPA: Gfo/Idh/MocA family oxidoreductase [Terriglobales bacterium]|nr:Gfo/Idh/MocA family oxidoreductase [Terriglobales bacterium]